MSDQSLRVTSNPAWASFEAVEEAARAARAHRLASGEVMTYVAHGWVVREYPTGRLERLAPVAEFRDEDFPVSSMMRLLVYAGPNGSGKSSLRDQGAQPDPVEVVIDPDRIARSLNAVNPRAANRAAGRRAITVFEASLAARRSISLETTLAGHSILRRLRAAKAAGYDIELRYVALENVALNIQRVRARAAQGGHFIDPTDIRRRHTGSLANLPHALSIVDRAILADNSGVAHRVVLEMVAGRITRTVSDLPSWLLPLMPQITDLHRF